MTREDIIGLIADASAHNPGFSVWILSTAHIERIVNRAVEAEREACAKVCLNMEGMAGDYADKYAAAIRARGSK
jgi:hypothetical protein